MAKRIGAIPERTERKSLLDTNAQKTLKKIIKQTTGRPRKQYPEGTKKVGVTLFPEQMEFLEEISYLFVKESNGVGSKVGVSEIVRSVLDGLKKSGVVKELVKIQKEQQVSYMDGTPKTNSKGEIRKRLAWDESGIANYLKSKLKG